MSQEINRMIWEIIIITAIAGVGGTGIGGLIGAAFRKDSGRIVSLLLSFAAGIMLGVVCFDLVPEAITQEGVTDLHSLMIAVFGTIAGFIIVYLLNHAIDKSTNHEVPHIDKSHPQTADSLDELIHSNHYEKHAQESTKGKKYELFIAGVVMACAIALHNLPEGMVIGASYARETATGMLEGGLLMAIVIGLHNVPEGMAVSVPLIAGGMRRRKAVLVTALTGSPTIIGAIAGYLLGVMSPFMLSLSLSFASGAMLYVVLGELLPEAILMWRSKKPAFAALIGLLVGLVLVYI